MFIQLLKKHSSIILILFFIYISIALLHTLTISKSIYGDGRYYVSLLDSIITDHDLDMSNQYKIFGIHEPLTKNNIPAQKYSIGFSLLTIPLYSSIRLLHLDNQPNNFYVHVILALYGSLVAMTGVYFLWITLSKIFSKTTSIWTLIAITLSTNLLFYGAVDTVNSHPYSFFIIATLLLLVISKSTPLALGAFSGISFLIRPQDAVVLIFTFLNSKQYIKWFYTIPIFIIVVVIQMIITYIIYGSITTHAYFENGKEGFLIDGFHLLEVLFSTQFGLITLSPILLFAFAGIFFPWINIKFSKLSVVLFIVLELFIVSSWSTWSQGASYGGRMFISSLPVLSIPLSVFFEFLNKKILYGNFIITMIVCSLSILNVLSILRFLLLSS